MTFRISYKFLKCLAGRITYSRARSILSAGRISFKFKNDLGAGRFHSAGRIRPAGRTLPTPTLHQNLEFILERPVDGKLPFLDTEVKQISNQLHTNVYRKATDTGLIMQYTSICPKSWKLGLINFYLNRALNICSNFTAFKDELTKIKNLLINNQCPKNLIEFKIN